MSVMEWRHVHARPPPATPYYPPRRSHGCLWGCLILLLIFVLPPALLGGYGAWFLWDGYRHSPVLRVVNELVREDGMARRRWARMRW